MHEESLLRLAIELASSNVAAGGGPFGAVIARDGEVVATGENRVIANLDPSAHAEVVAVRRACRATGSVALTGCVMYSSCEPCPMCITTALEARIGEIVYSADRHDALGAGFASLEFYDVLDRQHPKWSAFTRAHRMPESSVPFQAWLELDDRTQF